jgi:hypothetical protein
MERPYIHENARERARLRALVSRITDEELTLPYYKEGWTVAAGLAHLAFWDQYGLSRLRLWQETGVAAYRSDPSHSESTPVNDALLAVALAMPPRTAAELAVSSAEAVDREIAAASPDFVKAVEALNEPYRLNRSIHRKLHLDEIEALLAQNPSQSPSSNR